MNTIMTVGAPLIDADRPWPGLLPFTEDARAFFHGRDTEAAELTRLIEREPLTVLFGQSGLGKSSLLNAGVFPRLRRAGYLPLYLRLHLEAGAPPLMEQVWQVMKDECARHEVTATSAQPGDSFWRYLHRPNTQLLNPHGRPVTPVLAFDQFEEIFTLGQQTPQQSARCQTFLCELGELIENRLPPALEAELTQNPEVLDDFDLLRQDLKIVFTFREDYLAEFEGLKTLIRPIMQNRMRLTPMTGGQAAKAIQESGRDKVNAAVATRIVRFVGSAVRDETVPLEQIQVEPALLSLVCRELNEQRLAKGAAEISADQIQGGNTQQIIEQFYKQGFAGVDVKVKHFVEDRLLTAAGYRDSCALDNALATPGITEAALQTLVDHRILRREERGGLVRLELIHDVLAEVAKASRDRRRQEQALAEAKRQIAKQRRRQRFYASMAAGLLVVFGVVSWLAIDASRARATADEQRNAANAAQQLAELARSQAVLEGTRATNEAKNAVESKLLAESALQRAQSAEQLALQEKNATEAARAEGELTLGQALAEKADRAFAERRFNEGHVYAAHALARLKGQRSEATQASTLGARLSFPRMPSVTLQRSKGGSRGIAFSPDGRMVASGSVNDIQIWDRMSGNLAATLAGHTNHVRDVAMSPNGRLLASGSKDTTIRLWNLATGKSIATLEGHASDVTSIAFSPDGRRLVSGSADGSVRLWDVDSAQSLATLLGHASNVSSVTYSRDGKVIATGSWDGSVLLWDAVSGKALPVVMSVKGAVYGVAISPDGRSLASASSDKLVRLWDVASGKLLVTLDGHDHGVFSVGFSPDGRTLASGSFDRTVRLWDVASAKPLATLTGHWEGVSKIVFSPDGRTLASASQDGTVQLRELGQSPNIIVLDDHETEVTRIAYSPDGGWFASASGKTIHVRKAASRKTEFTLSGHGGPVWSLAFSPDGRTLASGSTDNTVKLWDARTGQVVRTLDGHTNRVVSIAFSPDGRTLLTGSTDKSIRLWDRESGKLISVATDAGVSESGATNMVFFPDGRQAAFCCAHNKFALWDVAGSKVVGAIAAPEEIVVAGTLSDDGRTVATVSNKGIVRVWDASSRKPRGVAMTHGDPINNIRFSPDGRLLATFAWDRLVRVWEVDSGKLRATLAGHAHIVSAVAFSPDGRDLASSAWEDKSVRIRQDVGGQVAVKDWRAEAVKEEQRYGLKLDGVNLVPK